MLWKETALPHCRATDSRWNRSIASLVSPVTAVIRPPNSCTNSTAWWFQVPADSMATGTKIWLLASCLYLASLLPAALSAAAPAMVAVSGRWESAQVSGSVPVEWCVVHGVVVILCERDELLKDCLTGYEDVFDFNSLTFTATDTQHNALCSTQLRLCVYPVYCRQT